MQLKDFFSASRQREGPLLNVAPQDTLCSMCEFHSVRLLLSNPIIVSSPRGQDYLELFKGVLHCGMVVGLCVVGCYVSVGLRQTRIVCVP